MLDKHCCQGFALLGILLLVGLTVRCKCLLRSRKNAEIIRALAADRDRFASDQDYFATCFDAAMEGPYKPAAGPDMEGEEFEEGGAGGPEEKVAGMEPWMAGVAKRVWRMCHSLRSELMHERLISLLVEWCETPRAESACVAYKDTCVAFLPDSEEKVLRHVQKSPANNCYLYIPHSLLDPVLEAHCAKLSEFYAHTFWANKDVFLCCQAALALAKRGINVDRCFIGESPGGVGQSLYSLHLATMLGNNHGFFDPNVWYNEDELRKQVETFARCIVVTGQEAPESAKKLHLDLFKKTMSGDGIAGRKPYGFTTKMFQLIGWKRLEVNRMLRFAGVTASNFNSVFRRGFFWQAKARFHPPHVIATLHPDHEMDGHFQADPTLKQFLSSSPSAAAGLRIQHAFESVTGRQECLDLIENYVAGGDESLTEDKMRAACGLPVRDRSKDTGKAGAVLLHIPDSQDDKELEEKKWLRLRLILVNDMLDRCVSSMTLYQFQQMKFDSNEIPNHTRADLWKGLHDRRLVVKGCARHTRGRASVQMQPVLVPEKNFFEAVNAQKADESQVFVETVSSKAARAMADKNCGLQNLDTLLAFFQSKIKAIKPKRGRPSGQAEETILKFEKLAQKAAEQKNAYKEVCQLQDPAAAALSPPRRRNTAKTEQRIERHVTYRYVGTRATRDRRYANGFAAQACSRRLQKILFPHTVDLDIQGCCLAILLQLYEKILPQPPLPEAVLDFLNQCVQNRKEVCEKELQVSVSDGKQIINSVLHGGPLPAHITGEPRKKLLRLSIYMRWLASSIFSEEFDSLSKDTDKRHPDATIFFYMWTTVEDWIVASWVSRLQTFSPEHLSLHFDGVRLDSDSMMKARADQRQFLDDCEGHIYKETGFKVTIVEKKPLTLLQLVEASASRARTLDVASDLLAPSNSICCACWHLLHDRQQEVQERLSASCPANSYAEERGVRTYKQCAGMLGLTLVPIYGLPPLQDGKFLLHLEVENVPCCVAVLLDKESKEATVFAGKQEHLLSYQQLLDSYLLCIDRLLVVSFALAAADDAAADADSGENADGNHLLLDLEAGSAPEASAFVSFQSACTGQEICALLVSEHCTVMEIKQRIAIQARHLPFAVVLLVDNGVVPLATTWSGIGFPKLANVVLVPRTARHANSLAAAVVSQQHEQVIKLLEAGQEPDCWCVVQRTARMEPLLLTAVGAGFFYSVHLLLNALANPDAVEERSGRSALHEAVLADSPVSLHLLIQHKGNVHARDSQGTTPLHIAALHEMVGLVKQLVFAGADPLVPDLRHDVPLCLGWRPGTRAALMDACWQRLSWLTFFLVNGRVMAQYEPKLEKLCRGLCRSIRGSAAPFLIDLQGGASTCIADDWLDCSDSEDALPEVQYLVDDEGAVFVADAILGSLEEERNSFQEQVEDSQGQRNKSLHVCRLCPFRAFKERRKLLTHLRTHHTARNQFACSGTKQIKIILSLHDADCARRSMQFAYLQRSAQYMRTQVCPPLSHKRNEVDRFIRLLLTGSGPVYCNESALGVTLLARRVRNIFYDKSFAEILYRELAMHHANASWTKYFFVVNPCLGRRCQWSVLFFWFVFLRVCFRLLRSKAFGAASTCDASSPGMK